MAFTPTLDDRQADATQAAAEEGERFSVLLAPRHAAYLRARAAAHGEAPERHLEGILRRFRAHHDDWRAMQAGNAPTEPGMPAGTAPRRA